MKCAAWVVSATDQWTVVTPFNRETTREEASGEGRATERGEGERASGARASGRAGDRSGRAAHVPSKAPLEAA